MVAPESCVGADVESKGVGPLERHQVQTCFAWADLQQGGRGSLAANLAVPGAKKDASGQTPACKSPTSQAPSGGMWKAHRAGRDIGALLLACSSAQRSLENLCLRVLLET